MDTIFNSYARASHSLQDVAVSFYQSSLVSYTIRTDTRRMYSLQVISSVTSILHFVGNTRGIS